MRSPFSRRAGVAHLPPSATRQTQFSPVRMGLLERMEALCPRKTTQRSKDPNPWRLPSGASAFDAQRFRDHRFRGRAGAQPRGAARQAVAAARCRRHAAIVQLRPSTALCGTWRTTRSRARKACTSARARGRRKFAPRSWRHMMRPRVVRLAGRELKPRAGSGSRVCSSWRRPSTSCAMSSTIGRDGRAFRCRESPNRESCHE